MSQSCFWPKGIIYEKLETLVEDVLGNSWLETLAIKADHKVSRTTLIIWALIPLAHGNAIACKGWAQETIFGMMTDWKNSSQRGHGGRGIRTKTRKRTRSPWPHEWMIGLEEQSQTRESRKFDLRQAARWQYICISHDSESLFNIRSFCTGMRLSHTALQRSEIHPSSLGDYIERIGDWSHLLACQILVYLIHWFMCLGHFQLPTFMKPRCMYRRCMTFLGLPRAYEMCRCAHVLGKGWDAAVPRRGHIVLAGRRGDSSGRITRTVITSWDLQSGCGWLRKHFDLVRAEDPATDRSERVHPFCSRERKDDLRIKHFSSAASVAFTSDWRLL